jgi:hypothetical protein
MGEWLNGKAERRVFYLEGFGQWVYSHFRFIERDLIGILGWRVYQKGLYEFNKGSVYDGNWQNHKLHG